MMTIDERLEFLLKSTESLHSNMQEMVSESAKRQSEDAQRWAEQEERWKAQDKRWEITDAQIDRLTLLMGPSVKPCSIMSGGWRRADESG